MMNQSDDWTEITYTWSNNPTEIPEQKKITESAHKNTDFMHTASGAALNTDIDLRRSLITHKLYVAVKYITSKTSVMNHGMSVCSRQCSGTNPILFFSFRGFKKGSCQLLTKDHRCLLWTKNNNTTCERLGMELLSSLRPYSFFLLQKWEQYYHLCSSTIYTT